jgi:hypothetical protein
MITDSIEFAEKMTDTYLDAKGYKPYSEFRKTFSPVKKIVTKVYHRHDYKTTAGAPRGLNVRIYNDGVGYVVRVVRMLNGSDVDRGHEHPVEDVANIIGLLQHATKG